MIWCFFFKQKTAYEMRISDWSSDVCSSDLNLLQRSPIANIDFMSAGPQPPSAAELLSSDRLQRLIETLGGKYDHVVVDSPPMLGLADATLIARSVEGVGYDVESERVAARGR